MLDRVRDNIERNGLLPPLARVLVGVSGGVDSMTLCWAMHRLGYRVEAAHVNYRLRGEASDADEALVVSFCEENALPVHVMKAPADLKASSAGRSFQEAARSLRYTFFAETAQERGIAHVAVGHNLDDQAETVLLKLVTGSGIEGLGGMRPGRPLTPGSPVRLIRPLLSVARDDILAFAREKGIPWREDRSNEDPVYARNAVRQRIMPLMEAYFGASAPDVIARSARLVQGYWTHTIQPDLERRFEHCRGEEDRSLLADRLNRQPEVWQGRLILEAMYRWFPGRAAGYQMIDAIRTLLPAQAGRKVVLGRDTVWRERDALVFVRGEEEETHGSNRASLTLNEIVFVDRGALEAAEAPPGCPTSEAWLKQHSGDYTIYADREKLNVPLLLRPWEAGDRIVPFGMKGHKNVSDVLTDARVPSRRRAGALVVVSGDDVVWIPGVRMSDTIKVDAGTKDVVRLTFRPA